jgi:MFS family permease
MAAANLCSTSCFSCFLLFPLFIRDHGGDKAEIGLMMGAMSLASVVFRPWISRLVDRFGRKRSFVVGCVLQAGLSLTYLGFMDGTLAEIRLPLLGIRVIHGVAVAFCFTGGFTYIADIIPPYRINEGIGMFGVAGLSGMALGPALGEWVIRFYGFEGLYVTASFFALLALVLQFPLPESFSNDSRTRGPSFLAVLFRPHTFRVAVLALLFGVGLAAYGGFVAPYGESVGLPFVTL